MPNYDAVTPQQWVITIVVSILAGVIGIWLFYHYTRAPSDRPDADARPGLLALAWSVGAYRLRGWLEVMSRGGEAAGGSPGTSAVHELVRQTGSGNGSAPEAPDNGELPRVGVRLSDDAIIAFLAAQWGDADSRPRCQRDGHRFSANAIEKLVGGTRQDVLAIIREVREGVPRPVFFHKHD